MTRNLIRTIAAVLLLTIGSTVVSIPAQGKSQRRRTPDQIELYIVEEDGIQAILYDRRHMLGFGDTYGYIMFKNTNKFPVTVKYQVYGFRKDNGKKVRVDTGSVDLAAGQAPTWGYTYSYGDFKDRFGEWKNFEKYALAVKVVKGNGSAGDTPIANDNDTTPLGKKYKAIYNKIYSGNKLTSKDYDTLIDVFEGYSKIIMTYVKYASTVYGDVSDKDLERWQKECQTQIDRATWAYNLLMNYQAQGKLSSSQQQRIATFVKQFESIIPKG